MFFLFVSIFASCLLHNNFYYLGNLKRALARVKHPRTSVLLKSKQSLGCFEGNGTKCDYHVAQFRLTSMSRERIELFYDDVEAPKGYSEIFGPFILCWNEECFPSISSQTKEDNGRSPIFDYQWKKDKQRETRRKKNYYVISSFEIGNPFYFDPRCCY